MGMLSAVFRRWGRPDPAAECELDRWIQDALSEDALAPVPSGAWERLRRAATERETYIHGMWVLEQPLHDPREVDPAGVTDRHLGRNIPVHGTRVPYHEWHAREAMWGTLLPTSALLNW